MRALAILALTSIVLVSCGTSDQTQTQVSPTSAEATISSAPPVMPVPKDTDGNPLPPPPIAPIPTDKDGNPMPAPEPMPVAPAQ